MDSIPSQITSLTIVYSAVYSGADQRKHQSSASLAFVRGIHRGPVNSPHKWPVTRKMFPFDDVIMCMYRVYVGTFGLNLCIQSVSRKSFHRSLNQSQTPNAIFVWSNSIRKSLPLMYYWVVINMLQTTFSNVFLWTKMITFVFEFPKSLFLTRT